MIEHPVPQNITEYQFHLIGNMTIKQFLVLLVGVILGFVFYSTNLPGIIKWPFVFLMVGGAAALAFVPYEERTLDQWLVNFIRAIYRPTKFYWRRNAPIPDYFGYKDTDSSREKNSVRSAYQPQRQRQVSAYLSSLQNQDRVAANQDPLDLFTEDTSKFTALFDTVEAAENVTPGKVTAIGKPDLQVRARPLGSRRGLVFTTPEEKEEALAQTPVPAGPTHRFQNTDQTFSPTFKLGASATQKSQSGSRPNKPTGNIHTTDVNTIASAAEKANTASPDANQSAKAAAEKSTSYTKETKSIPKNNTPIPVVFDRDLPFPSLPEKPNLLLGMVKDPAGTIVPGAIVEILDQNNHTVRAMKTNNLGQFYISTPLKTGTYTIETEANGHTFPVYSLEINDTVLGPIAIQATA